MGKKLLKYIFLLLLLAIFIFMSIDIPYVCISLLVFSMIYLLYTKRIQLKAVAIFLCFVGTIGGIYFWCPKDRPWNVSGFCYSCQDEKTIEFPINWAKTHNKACPNRFLQEENCCGHRYYTSSLEKNTVFSIVLCRCVSELNYIEILITLKYPFYFFIWALILKLLGLLNKRKAK